MNKQLLEQLETDIRADSFVKENLNYSSNFQFMEYGDKLWVFFKTDKGVKEFAERFSTEHKQVKEFTISKDKYFKYSLCFTVGDKE